MRVQEFTRRVRRVRHVQQCYYVTGEWDFVAVIVARDVRHYENILTQDLLAIDNIKKITTTIVLETAKATLELPVR